MTETTPVATVGRLKRHMLEWTKISATKSAGKQGWPAPFVELRVTRPGPDARTLKRRATAKQPGELEVRGPWVAASYYNSPDQAHRWTADGWFKTGDVSTIDDEGFIKIVDRAKDLVKSGGEWISSVDLENTLMGHPAVKEAAVVASRIPNGKSAIGRRCPERRRHRHSRGASRISSQILRKWQLPDAFVFVPEIRAPV